MPDTNTTAETEQPTLPQPTSIATTPGMQRMFERLRNEVQLAEEKRNKAHTAFFSFLEYAATELNVPDLQHYNLQADLKAFVLSVPDKPMVVAQPEPAPAEATTDSPSDEKTAYSAVA